MATQALPNLSLLFHGFHAEASGEELVDPGIFLRLDEFESLFVELRGQ